MTPSEQLTVLNEAWAHCEECALYNTRSSDDDIVHGTGRASADVLILTDAPSGDDVHYGRSLVGEVGEAFQALYADSGMKFSQAYRTSLVACHPYVIIPETEEEEERVQDRKPAKAEIDACFPRLQRLIYIVDPKLIIAAGFGVFKALVRTKDRGRDATTISKAHGRYFVTYVQGKIYPVRYPVLALLPPLQLLTNPSTATHGPIATITQSLRLAARHLRWLEQTEEMDLP